MKILNLLKSINNNRGNSIAIVLISIMMIIIFGYIEILETEHNAHVEQKGRMEDAIRSASKAAILQVDISEYGANGPNYDRAVYSIKAEEAKITNNMAIDKNKSNTLIEKIIADNFGLVYGSDIKTLRKYLVLRAYSEPQEDGSILLTMFGPNNYEDNTDMSKVKITKANETIMRKEIENQLNGFILRYPISGSTSKVNITSGEMKPIPELRIDMPCIILFLQDYPIKTFLTQQKLNVFYVSPANIQREIMEH